MKKVFTLKTINYIMIAMALVFTVGCDLYEDDADINMKNFSQSNYYKDNLIPIASTWKIAAYDSLGSNDLGNKIVSPFCTITGSEEWYSLITDGVKMPLEHIYLDGYASSYELYSDTAFYKKSNFGRFSFPCAATYYFDVEVENPNFDSLREKKIENGFWILTESNVVITKEMTKRTGFDFSGKKNVQALFVHCHYDSKGNEYCDSSTYTFSRGYGLLYMKYVWHNTVGNSGWKVYAAKSMTPTI